ncbi:MAG TPA: hypothetical protein VGP62_00600 [Bryobacteraceae bacterium]|jgi:hypothetical protein|nr:hypothetical protein [Bryobacteraceae bacterium]
MKLRLHGNSLRLRLNQAEVAQFSKTGYVEESIEFSPGASLCYILESSSKITTPRAVFQNSELRIQVSCAASKEWATTDRVGISGEQSLANGKPLSILIEKDFKCMHGDNTDADAYPNPMELGTRG